MLDYDTLDIGTLDITASPKTIFAGKPSSQTLEWSPVRGSAGVGSKLPRKYETRVKGTNSDKYTSLVMIQN